MNTSKTTHPFSFEEIVNIPHFEPEKPSFVSATDDVQLAYYSFLPLTQPKAIVIFYHGGGIYTNPIYQYVGMSLKNDFNIGSYFVDIRGHGHSGGPRGDAPSINQVMDDITTIIQLAKTHYPNTQLYLTGHSSGAGLLLNYSAYKNKQDDGCAGYISLAPYLGPRIGIEQAQAVPFVKKVRLSIFLLNQLFRIPLFQHTPAIFFNYPEELLQADPLILSSYTYTMSCATTPHDPADILKNFQRPSVMYIAEKDEQFDPVKVINFVTNNGKKNIKTVLVPDAKHLSILLQAPQLINQAIGVNL